jgi:LysR family glycine cleavage system transcriptional activator
MDLFLDTTDSLVDFDTSDVDVAIRYAIPTDGNYYMSKIRTESLVAVLSPSLLADAKVANPNPDINDFPILEDAFDSRWNEWAELSKKTLDRATNSIVKYTDSAVMISAAINSQGIALARLIMVEDDIAQGRLVMFNQKQVTLERQLLFLCRRSERNEAGVAAFRRWLKALE